MQIGDMGSVGLNVGVAKPALQAAPTVSVGTKFSSVLEAIGSSMSKDTVNLEKMLTANKPFEARELLLCQLKVHSHALRVELVSKMSEGLSQSVKRLQNAQ